MAYSNKIYRRAERILEERRNESAMMADIRSSEIKATIPEIEEIQRKLSKVGLEISKLFFYKGDMDEKLAELKAKSKALIDERGAILVKNGYSENAMQPEHICPVCEDRGFIDGKLCTCHRQLLKDIMHDEIAALAPIDDCTFEKFNLEYYSDVPLQNSIVPRLKAEKVAEAAHRYAQSFSLDSKNLLFLGKTGLGKTHLSLAIANVVINRGYYVCYGTSQNICSDLQTEQFHRDDPITYTKQQVLNCDLLVLDDLGTEIDNQYSIATLYNIINSRILAHKPTIISTNYGFEELLQKYDQRITSRITGEYIKMYLFGDDIRNKK